MSYGDNMKKTVVLMASPRLQSNTDILANRVMDGIRSTGSADDRLDKIDLVELGEFVCCACGQCRAAGECLQFPEVTEILEKIEEADGLVLATPTWWLGPSSYLKIFIDHWGAFLRPDHTSRISGKKAVIVACCGNAEINLAEEVCDHLSQILSFLQLEVVDTLGVPGVVEHGAVSRNNKALEDAFRLGTALYSPEK